jgi:hypothetical protein
MNKDNGTPPRGGSTPIQNLGSPLGSQGTPNDKVSVVVTTSESIAMLDTPTYETITTLEDKATSFAAQGTVVNPFQHMTQACKRQIRMTLAMQDHAHKSDWETLSTKDLFKVLKEIFPRKTDISGQTIYEYLADKSKSFDFDVFDHTKLVAQACTVLAKLETLTIPPGDIKQAIKQLTRDIVHGVGGTTGTKRFLTNEVEKEKPANLEAYFDFILKTHHETKKVALEAIRRGILSHDDIQASGDGPDSLSTSKVGEPNLKKVRSEPSTPTSHACNGCGRTGHKWKECVFVLHKHPDHNSDNSISWDECPSGIEWSKLGEKFLPSRKSLSKKPFDYGPLNGALKRKSNEIGK